MNKSDSERIAQMLEDIGYRPVSRENEAGLILVNMCSVRQSAVDRIYGFLSKIKKLKEKKPNLKTILTGCILKEDRKKFAKGFDLILNIKDLPKWTQKIPCPAVCAYRKKEKNYLRVQPKHQTNLLAFVPISNGCNNFCSYCVVPFTRGSLVCRNHKDILGEVKNLTKRGFKEIWLLGQNVNDYHSPADPSISFAKLLKMINDIPDGFKILFTSPHPKNFSDELIKTLAKCEKFDKYLNLPVQSGDNQILKKMNRNYTVGEYKNLVKKIRKEIPGIKLSTDVIVGFPGETKKQSQNTVKLFKEIRFDNAYISKYSPRPGTTAWQMKDNIPLVEKKRREKILRGLIKQYGPR